MTMEGKDSAVDMKKPVSCRILTATDGNILMFTMLVYIHNNLRLWCNKQ